jgi:hypothetical protein
MMPCQKANHLMHFWQIVRDGLSYHQGHLSLLGDGPQGKTEPPYGRFMGLIEGNTMLTNRLFGVGKVPVRGAVLDQHAPCISSRTRPVNTGGNRRFMA